jgi:hypothetical protein
MKLSPYIHLFNFSAETTITHALQCLDNTKSSPGSITFRLATSTTGVAVLEMGDDVTRAESSLHGMNLASQVIDNSLTTAQLHISDNGPWLDLIQILKNFDAAPIVSVIDAVAEVNFHLTSYRRCLDYFAERYIHIRKPLGVLYPFRSR